MTPAPGRVSLKDGKFKAIMGYLVTSKPGYLVNLVRLCLKIQRIRKIYSGVWIKKKKKGCCQRGAGLARSHVPTPGFASEGRFCSKRLKGLLHMPLSGKRALDGPPPLTSASHPVPSFLRGPCNR